MDTSNDYCESSALRENPGAQASVKLAAANAIQGEVATPDEMSSLNGLRFEIVSTRTVTGQRRDYVAYTVQVLTNGRRDSQPGVLERRYNEFLALYNALKRQYPAHFNSFEFPRKALLGNFTPEVIASRCRAFDNFLRIIGSVTQLRQSTAVRNFMQKRELSDALKFMLNGQFQEAALLVENCYRVMSKLQTDRSPSVIQNLCLLICLYKRLNDPRALDLASLAVRRFQGISDSDLLKYYVPLFNAAIDLSNQFGRQESMALDEHLGDLKKRGFVVNANVPLLRLVLHDIFPDGCQGSDAIDSIDC